MTDRALTLAVALAIVLVLLAAPLVTEAQQAAKLHRIAYLSSFSAEIDKPWVDAFRQALRELGYAEGKEISIELRHAAGQYEKLAGLVAEFVRLKVDVLVVAGAPSARAAQKATNTIPIVMTVHSDPVGDGLVASLARPGGNITGLSDFHGDLVPKRLELLKEVAPSVSRVAFLFNPSIPAAALQLKLVQAAAPHLGLTLLPFEARVPDDIDRAFAAMREARLGAVLVHGEPMLATHRRRIAGLAIKGGLPVIGTIRQWADAGFLMSYGTNFHHLWRRAATYVDKILKGANPADLPVEQPTKFELVINLKTAKALGLTIPPVLLLRADQVIEQ